MLVCITPGKRGEAWGGQEHADLLACCVLGVCAALGWNHTRAGRVQPQNRSLWQGLPQPTVTAHVLWSAGCHKRSAKHLLSRHIKTPLDTKQPNNKSINDCRQQGLSTRTQLPLQVLQANLERQLSLPAAAATNHSLTHSRLQDVLL